jgi:hypothetical protein
MSDPLEDPRLTPLLRLLKVDYAEPFVVTGPAAKEIGLLHYNGGRDASYVLVNRLGDPQAADKEFGKVTINPKNIDGTTIIYDVTDETLQGKARPFACDLKSSANRVYAILPYQIENIELRAEKNEFDDVRVHVAFLDARGERLKGALPFARWLTNSLGSDCHEAFATTNQDGTYSHWLNWGPGDGGTSWTVSVRSLLTGRTKSVRFEKKV